MLPSNSTFQVQFQKNKKIRKNNPPIFDNLVMLCLVVPLIWSCVIVQYTQITYRKSGMFRDRRTPISLIEGRPRNPVERPFS